jgi:hypothetical protein
MISSYKIAILGLLALPISLGAQSRTAIAVGGGVSIPVGKLRDTQTSGSDILFGLVRGSDDSPIGFRLDAAYDRLKGKNIGGTAQPEIRTASGTANLVFSFSGFSLKPYAFGGIGGFKMTSKPSVPGAKVRFGFDFGIGFTMPLAGKAIFLESRVNSISQPNAKPYRYVPIVVGLLF